MAILENRRRAELAFDRLIEAFRRRAHPFDNYRPLNAPENIPSHYGSRRLEACYWFQAIYPLRGPNRNEYPLRNMIDLFRRHRGMFDPQVARRFSPDDVTARLQDFGLGYKAGEIGRGWVLNANRLYQHWGSNPLRIFQGVTSYQEVYERMCHRGERGFYGYQEKMSSLLMHFLVQATLIPSMLYPSPTDRHASRIVLGHELVRLDYTQRVHNKHLVKHMRQLFVWYCQRRQVSPRELSEAMYHLSRTQCEQHPGNTVWINGPIQGNQTVFEPNEFSWDEQSRPAYARTCGQCPIESSCRRCVPLVQYDITGYLHPDRIREKPPTDK